MLFRYVIWFVFLKKHEKGTGERVLKHYALTLKRDGMFVNRKVDQLLFLMGHKFNHGGGGVRRPMNTKKSICKNSCS